MVKLSEIIKINKENNISLQGMTDEFFCAYISEMFNESNKNFIVLTSTLYEANKIFTSLQNYMDKCLLFPMDDFLTSESIAISPDLKSSRLDTLRTISLGSNNIIITHLDAFVRILPSKNYYLNQIIKLKKGDIYNRDSLIKNISNIGYNRETIVTNTGEMAIRGFVLDLFPINNDNPIRIEFFDDEIESIRYFDPETQKSIGELDDISIFPNTELLSDHDLFNQKELSLFDNFCSIYDYLDNPILIVKDLPQIKASYEKLLLDVTEYHNDRDKQFNGLYVNDLNVYLDLINYYYDTIDSNVNKKSTKFDILKVPLFKENIDAINNYIKSCLNSNKTIVIVLKEFQINSFIKYIDIDYVITNFNNIFANKLNIIKGSMQEGFIYNDFVFISENELFNLKVKTVKYKNKFKYSSKIKNINAIEKGDYVVHIINGIGIYNGIKTLKKGNLEKDYLEILYAGTDKLYIPVEKIDLISKYTGKEGMVPKIHKLNSSEWTKTKIRVREKVKDTANKLIELYAKRSMKKGYQFSHDNELQLMFEKEFQFAPTRDQLYAIDQIKQDMESISPMDRLLCGDVGYGKTEVAFRAMFKSVNDSKQVMYLCPTTILSNQQGENAKERFKNFPVNIEILNRFTSLKETKRIIKEFGDGKIDILFGTHRILSDDIKPYNLGLLIIDEEQRFGVNHKEKVKEYKENIDVLTLTATPIPRTLQMSLVGLRSLSLIETPPVDRYPIQTYVIEENKQLIKDAIYKEMSRNGQIYILYNSVEKIEQKVLEIQRLVPEARIVYAHGKLSKTELENRMMDFINFEYDILICTTIIETGIDIPNVNTLIIFDADRFGLSQLYQIRGRVGRSNKIAYSYLMYTKNKILNENAIKRLNAIKEFTELGSGFSIANRDLAIRGAGDILGSEQAGFIDSVGIDLYLKILNNEVKRLKGEEIEEETINDNKTLIEVDTHISDSYVEESELKIEIHKLINNIDSLDKLQSVKLELEDRFGRLDDKIIVYMYEEWFESLARKLNVINVHQDSNRIELTLDKIKSNNIDGEQLFIDAINISRNFNFRYKNGFLVIILDLANLDKHYIYYLTDLLSRIKIKNE